MSFTQAPKPAAAVFGKFCLTGFFLFALLARAGATVLLSDNFSGTAGSLLAGTALDTGGNWSIAQTDGGGNMNGKFIFASGGGVVASNNTAANIFTTFDAGTQTNGFTLSVSFIARGYSGIGFSLGFASAMDKGYFQNLATGDVIRFNYAGGGTGPGTFKWAVYDESVLSDNSSSVRAGGQPVSTNDEIRLSITCYPALGMIGGEATNVTQGFLISKLKLGVNTPGLTNLLYVGFGVNDIVVSNAAAPAVIKSFTVSTAPDFNVSRPLVLATNPPPTMTGFAFEDFNGTGTAAFTNVLAEHAPIDLMHAVRPTVYDTVRATYPQKIILKQLAWGGTAGIALDSIYPGHCLMKAGTRLTNSLPATTNDAVLYLEDSSLVAKSQSGIDSITNTPESYVLLYGLDANGRPDWSRAEHVRLITVDTNASSVTVRRAQLGTGPFAFTNGQAVVARHMMFWSGQWQLNFSLQSPRGGPFNLTAAEWFALQVAQILYIGDADGVECDVGRWQWGYPANNPMDCDNDRVADYGYIDGVCSFGLGGQVYQKHLREILGPNKIIQMDGNDAQFGQRGWQYVNGAQMESFPNGNHFERFSEAFLHFRQWVNNVVPVPAFTYAFSKTTTTLFGHVLDTDGSNVDWHFRVGFAASLLIGMPHPFASITDITFDPANPDYNNPNLQEDKGFYKWDEYVGGTNDLNSWKWLGSPTGPAAQITNNLVPANLLAATVWEWKTETNFTAAVAITNGEYSAAISQIPSNTLPWTSGVYPGTSVPLTLWAGVRLQAAAGAPALQPGREYTLEFDARGNDSWDYAGQTFPKVPRALAIYGIANNGNNNPLAIALGPVWKTYRVTLNSDSTNPPPIIFAVSEQVGNAALRNLHLYQGGAERWVRRYENGIVLLNMTKQPWTNTLTAPYRRINGTQNPDLNDGQPVPANIVVPVWDALFLVANATNLTWQGASAGSADWGNALTGWTNSTGVATFTSSNAVTFDNTAPALTVNLPGTVTPVAINITNDAAHNLTLAGGGKISGETFLAKTGPGAVTLANTGGNDFTGGVLLKAGTLNLGAATALGAATGTLTITGGALDNTSGGALTTPDYPQAWNGDFAFTGTADLNLGAGAVTLGANRIVTINGGNLTLGGVIGGGAVGLVKAGAGALTLNGANTFTAGVTLNTGTLNLGNAAALGASGTFTIAGGMLNNTSGGALTTPNYPQAWNGDFAFTGTSDLNLGTGAVTLGANRTLAVNAGTLTVGGVIGGSSKALTKTGAGRLVLSGANTYTGNTTISNGTLLVNGSLATGAVAVNGGAFGGDGVIGGNVTVAAGAGLIPGGSGDAGTLTITNKSLTFAAGGSVTFDLGGSTTTGGGVNDLIDVNGGLTNATALTVNFNFLSGVPTAGTYTLMKFSSGKLGANFVANLAGVFISNSRHYTVSFGSSSTTVTATFVAPSGNATNLVWQGAASGGGTNWADATAGWTNASGTTTVFYNLDAVTFNNSTVSTNVNVAADVAPASVTVNNDAAHNYLIAGAGGIGGPGGLTKLGAGTLTIATTNTFTGGVVLSNASGNTLVVSADANLGAGTNVTINQNATLQATASFATAKNVTFIGVSPGLNVSAGATLTLNGIVGGTSTTPGKNGAGTLVLNHSNSFPASAVFLVSNGGLGLGHAAALNNAVLKYNGGDSLDNVSGVPLAPTGLMGVEMTGGFTFTGTDDLDLSAVPAGFVQTAGGARTLNIAAKTLTLGGILSTGTDAAGTTRVSGALTKSGAGTLVLAAVSDFTNATTVTAGTLLVNGTLGSTNVAVNGGWLGGGGSITGAVVVAAGAGIMPGNTNTVATLTLRSNLTATGGTIPFDLSSSAAGGNDKLAVTGSVTLGGATNTAVSLNYLSGALGQGTYTLATFASRSGNTFALDRAYPNATLAVGTTNLTLAVGAGGSGRAVIWRGDGAGNLWDLVTTPNWTDTNGASALLYGDGADVTFDDSAANFTVNLNTNVAPGSVTVNSANNYVIQGGGRIGGTGGLTKSGAGSLTISGTNTFTGATVVNAGTLVASGSLAGLVTVAAGASLVPGGAGAGNPLTIGGSLTLNGGTLPFDLSINPTNGGNDKIFVTGSVTLGGASNTVVSLNYLSGALDRGTYTLMTFASKSGNTFELDHSYPNLTLSNTATNLTLVVGTGGSGQAVVWRGDGAGNVWDIFTTPDWVATNGTTPLVYADGAAVTFDNTATNPVVNLGVAVAPGNVTVNSSSNYFIQGGGSITGAASLTKSGTGALTLTNANSFTGGTTHSGGTLNLGHPNALGGGNLVLNGGSLATVANLNGGGVTNRIVLKQNSTVSCATNFAAVWAAPITNDGTPRTLTFLSTCKGSVFATNVFNAVNGWGHTVFTLGSGSPNLRILLGVDNALPAIGSVTNASAQNAQITVDLQGHNQTIAGLACSGGPVAWTTATGAPTLTINTPAGSDFTYSGQNRVIQNAIKIVKTGEGVQRIAGVNGAQGGISHSGGTVILAGTFVAGTNGIGTGPVSITNALLQVADGTALTIKSNLVGETTAIIDLNGGTLTVNSGGNSEFAGIVTNAGNFIKTGTGLLTLSGANTFAGSLAVSGGALKIGNGTALGGGFTLTNTVTNQFPALCASGATLDLNGQSVANRGLTLNGGKLANSNAAPAVVGGDLGGAVQAIGFTSGTGLAAGTTVAISGGGGSGAGATLSLGLTPASLTLASGGSGYKVNDVLTITNGGGIGATVTVNSTNGAGVIATWTLTLAGSGFTNLPTGGTGGGTGSGTTFTGVDNNFGLVSLTVTNGGSGYVSQPAVALSSGSFTGHAVLANASYLLASSTVGGAGDITIAQPVGGAGALTKVDAGMLTLTGTNSYTGGTTVSNGTLLVNGALAGGAVNVKSNATLGGSGVIAGGVSVAAGGVLRPGLGGADTSPLAFGSSLSLTGATVIAISRANVPNASTLTGITALTRGGTLTVTNVGPAPVAGDSFPLFSAASSSGNFTATNLPALDAGLNWWPSNNYAALVVNGSPVVSNFLMGAISGVTNRFKLIGSQFAPAGEAGETLTVTAVGAAAHGPATTDGTNLIYVATNGFAGADSFTYTVSDGRGGTATATVTVNVILGGTNLSRLTPVGGTGGVLVYSNLAGFNCVLDWATNLSPANWQPLLTNTAAPTNGLISFTNALVAPRNFFRTRHAP